MQMPIPMPELERLRSMLSNVKVEAGASVIESNCVDCEIGAGAKVGPYSYLRAGTELGAGSKAGAYVEIKTFRCTYD